MQDQIKSLPKKYIQYTDENKKDRRKAYVALDEVLEIVNKREEEMRVFLINKFRQAGL